MGVPAFFRWLTEKYPKVLQDVLEERVKLVGGDGRVRAPFDSTRPSPSGIECDNLYIDMNGIIHPCSHPEHGPQPKTEEEMYENVCHYVDRLFRIMRPRKLLYLAIDGVAPRAKMNQQRSRRFRSAQEARENLEVEENIRKELTKNGQKLPPAKKAWDSNVITPGTPFMLRLAEFIRFYIRKRINTDKAWQNIRVIFSDASIPGEGEHKIMAHIRLQRSQPGYSPNLVHVLHGLDADLIMLALATHEAHFYISREEVMFGRKSQEMAERRQNESGYRDKQRQLDEEAGDMAMQLLENKQTPICRVSIPILREYLAADFAQCIDPARLPFAPSLERLIDDIVFLCFFVGNDFLPHLPSLDIRDGALDYLFNVYKRILPSLGDYITNHGGKVNLSHVDVILAEVGSIEDYVFTMKHDNEQRDKERREQFKARKKQVNGRSMDDPRNAVAQQVPKVMGRAARILEKQKAEHALKTEVKGKIKSSHMKSRDNLQAAIALKESLKDGCTKKEDDKDSLESENGMDVDKKDESGVKIESEKKRKIDEVDDESAPEKVKDESGVGNVGSIEDEFDEDDEEESEEDKDAVAAAFKERVKDEQKKKLDDYAKNVKDNVRLHEKGWKDRYYTDKCKADDVANHGGRDHLFRSYVMGLCWVMKYYYEGCPSWKWYYPFHYAPFASDLRNIERFQKDVTSFELSTPFSPVEQLMAVLPSDSSHAIPKAGRWLMSDLESPIIDFYPSEVPVDPNGKAMPWLWVVLLPFIDEDRLLAAMTPTMAKWTKQELLCNARGLDDGYVFLHSSHPLATKFQQILKAGKSAKSPKQRLTDAASYGCPGFTGFLRPPLTNEIIPEAEIVPSPDLPASAIMTSEDNLFTESISENKCLCVAFSEPAKLSHKSIILPGTIPPPPVLLDEDKRICRPRLNRGGQSIAYMGGSGNRGSHQSGHGSMNISSYERELAQRTGRGHEMNKAGTRSWGSFEPAPKRQYHGRNPFNPNGNGVPPPPPPPPQRPPWQQQQQRHGYHQQQNHQQRRQFPNQNNNFRPNHHSYQQQQQHTFSHNNMQGRQHMSSGGNNGSGSYPQSRGHHQQQPRGNNQNYSRGGYQQQSQQGFNFRSANQTSGPSSRPQQPSGAVTNNVMNSLKAQLKSTLKQNRRGNDRR
jgi:5'-3' exoribonuclease 2